MDCSTPGFPVLHYLLGFDQFMLTELTMIKLQGIITGSVLAKKHIPRTLLRNTVNVEKCIWWRRKGTERTVSRLTPAIIKDMILTGWNIHTGYYTCICTHMSMHIKLKEMTFWMNQFYTTLAKWSQHVLSFNPQNKLIPRSHYLLLTEGNSLNKVKELPQLHQEPTISCLTTAKWLKRISSLSF